MKVLITGNQGYIGKILYKILEENGHNCFGLDIKQGRDLLKRSEIREYDVDVVVHLASNIQVRESLEHPEKYLSDNVRMTENALRIAKISNVSKFIFTSTASEGNPYALSKRFSEYLIQDSGLNYSILRLSNVAGGYKELIEDHEPETHLIPSLFNAIRDRRIFEVNGDGETVRDFVHVRDVCRAIEKEFRSRTDSINVGSGIGYSINQIISKVRDMLPTPQNEFSVYYRAKLNEPDKLISDKPKYKCKFNLDDILKDYADKLLS